MVAKETRLLFPAESGKLIVEKAQDVKVIPEGVERAADEVNPSIDLLIAAKELCILYVTVYLLVVF